MGVLDGKSAIVTGSARGIGRATAALLTEHGARVVISDLDGDVAAQTAAEIGGETAVFTGDLTRDGVPDALVQKAVDAFGQLDILVNNAGYTWDGVAHKMTRRAVPTRCSRSTRWHRSGDPGRCARPARCREAGARGRRDVVRKIVNVSSISGVRATPARPTTRGQGRPVGLTKTLARSGASSRST